MAHLPRKVDGTWKGTERILRIPMVAGFEASWDLSRPSGKRLTHFSYQGGPIRDDQAFKTVMNRYVYRSSPELRDAKLLTPLDQPRPELETLRQRLQRKFPKVCKLKPSTELLGSRAQDRVTPR